MWREAKHETCETDIHDFYHDIDQLFVFNWADT